MLKCKNTTTIYTTANKTFVIPFKLISGIKTEYLEVIITATCSVSLLSDLEVSLSPFYDLV